MSPDHSPVTIVGGGWAGLSAAIHLTRHHIPVTLIESAEQPGGRARMVMFDDLPVDNGQHIALGAYRNFLQLLDIIGIEERLVLSRLSLSLTVKGNETTVALHAPKLPAPLHLLAAFLGADGLSTADKAKTLVNWLRLVNADTDSGITVTELLRNTGQSERVTHYLWTPLCIAALNTHPDIASARIFQRVIRDAFMRRRGDSDILLPRYDLGRVFPQPALDWLRHQGVNVITGQRVTDLLVEQNRVSGIQLGDRTIPSSRVVIATNPWTCARLVRYVDELRPLTSQLAQFDYQPIATVYLKFAKSVLLKPAMLGLADSITQWLFDRRITSHPKMLAAIISAEGEHTALSKEALTQQVINDIKSYTPIQADPIDSMVIREKRATFSATPAMEQLRPGNKTPLEGCWIAGDYTLTGYPATLEGAIISGKTTAMDIVKGIAT
jgi:squalene-associated FAD-dependent desaturase